MNPIQLLLLSLALIIAFSGPSTTNAAPIITSNDPIKLPGLNYNARRRTDGSCPTLQEVTTDLLLLTNHTTTIKTFSLFDCNQGPLILNAITQHPDELSGLKLYLGLWINAFSDQFYKELDTLKIILNTHGSNRNLFGENGIIKGWIVGSEGLYRNEYNIETIIAYMTTVRNVLRTEYGIVNANVSTADTWTRYGDETLIGNVDFLTVNAFPYWQGKSVENGVRTALENFASIDALNKDGKAFLVGETGWPYRGESVGEGVANESNQGRYLADVRCLLGEKYEYFWFSAFDEPWKGEGVESHWGLMDGNGKVHEWLEEALNMAAC